MSTTSDRSTGGPRGARVSRWTVPIACVVIGVVYLLIGVGTDRVRFGITGLLVMLAYGAGLVLFRRRSEPVALLAGDTADERRHRIQLLAAAATGRVLVVAVVAALLWSMAADSRDVGVLSALAALGGLTLVASTVWYSRRG